MSPAFLDRTTALRLAPWLIMGVSAAALTIALASQYWGGLAPCVLCIYQRWVYGVAFAVGAAAALAGSRPGAQRALVGLGGIVFLAGAGLAVFHVGVEQHWWRGTAACHAPAIDPNATVEQLRQQLLETPFVPCDRIPWSLLGLSFAGWNALASIVFAAACLGVAWRAGIGRTGRAGAAFNAEGSKR